MGPSCDQPEFLKALLEVRATRFLALPPMWNATPFPTVDLQQMKRAPRRDPIFWLTLAPRLAEAHDTAERIGPSLNRL